MKNKITLFGQLKVSRAILRGLVFFSLMFINSVVFSQIKINVVNERGFEVRDTILGVDTLISNHVIKDNAVESLVNYQLLTGRKTARSYGQITRVDITGLIKRIEVDTIIANVRLDVEGKIVFGLIDNAIDTTTYKLFHDYGMINYKDKTNYFWQRKHKFKRTKDIGEISYEELDVPFQFMPLDSIVDRGSNFVKVRTFATEFHGVKYYIDGVFHTDYSDLNIANPGEAVLFDYPVRRHTKTLDGLEPNKTYILTVVGNARDGMLSIIEYQISTL